MADIGAAAGGLMPIIASAHKGSAQINFL